MEPKNVGKFGCLLPIVIRPSHVPDSLLRFPYNAKPLYRIMTARGIMARRLTISWAPSNVYRSADHRDWRELSEVERWSLAVSRWVRLTAAMQHNPALRGTVSLKRLVAAARCPPNGYRCERKGPKHYCGWSLCPHCYGRSVYKHYCDLVRAWKLRPNATAPVYAAAVRLTVPKPARFAYRIRRIQPAGAIAMYVPQSATAGTMEWFCRGIVLTDDRKRIASYPHVKISNQRGLRDVVTRWLRYPTTWARQPGWRSLVRADNLFKQIPTRLQVFSSFGACRADFVPRKGALDWTRYAEFGH